MVFPITSTLAAIFSFILIWLTINVSLLRIRHKSVIGEIKNDEFRRRNGALTNLTATLPLMLILMALAEVSHFCWGALICIALIYLVGRLTHIYSLYRYELKTGRYQLRTISMVTTFLAIIALALINLYTSYSVIHFFSAGNHGHYMHYMMHASPAHYSL